MKKLLLILGMFSLTFSISLVSCQDEERNSVAPDSYETLVHKLNDYSSSFFSEKTNETKSFKSFFKRLFYAVCQDVYITFHHTTPSNYNIVEVGAEIISSGQAFQNYVETSKMDSLRKRPIIPNETVKRLNNETVAEFNDNSENYGLLHNAVLLKLIMEEKINEPDISAYTHNVVLALEDLGINVSMVNESILTERVGSFQSFTDDINLSINVDALANDNPQNVNEIRILENFFSKIHEIESEQSMRQYTQGYKNIINSSSINDMSKRKLLHSLDIANESYSLWNIFIGPDSPNQLRP